MKYLGCVFLIISWLLFSSIFSRGGARNIGTTEGEILNFTSSAPATLLGKAFCGMPAGLEATFSNPAAAREIKGIEFLLQYRTGFPFLNWQAFSFGQTLSKNGGIFLGGELLRIKDIPKIDERGVRIGLFDFLEFNTWGGGVFSFRKVSFGLIIGCVGKTKSQGGVKNLSYISFGVLLRKFFNTDTTIGIAGQNLGKDLPANLKLGISQPFRKGIIFNLDFNFPVDKNIKINTGICVQKEKFNGGFGIETPPTRYFLGLGLKSLPIEYYYALEFHQELKRNHVFAIKIVFPK
jgi:hypothetical protein